MVDFELMFLDQSCSSDTVYFSIYTCISLIIPIFVFKRILAGIPLALSVVILR